MSSKEDSISDLLLPRGRLVGLTKRESRRTESDELVEGETGSSRGRVRNSPQMMLAFRKCSGEVLVLAYSLLTRIRSDDPDRGFAMSFSEAEIKIEGEKLTQLFCNVCEHRVMEIVEADRTAMMAAEVEPIVSKILINLRK